jgi:uncharacterized protein
MVKLTLPRSAWTWVCLGFALICACLPLVWSSPLAPMFAMLGQLIVMIGLRHWLGQALAVARTRLLTALGLWSLGYALVALILYWPLQSLRSSGQLMSALWLSAAVAALLLLCWRQWPWLALAEQGSDRVNHWLSMDSAPQAHSIKPGLIIALLWLLTMVAGLSFFIDLPFSSAGKWGIAIAQFISSVALHGYLQLTEIVGATKTSIIETPLAPGLTPLEKPPLLEPVPLYEAARRNQVDAALQAIELGADVHALPDENDQDQRSLAMLAVLLNDLRLLRELIKRGVDINRPHHGLTPLLAATRDSWHGRPEAVMTLLANGADTRIADQEGFTPLHHSVRSSDPAVAALLLDAGAQQDALNHEGFNALGVACAANNWRLAKFLIERGAHIEPEGGQSALLAAVSGEDDPAGAMLLLRHKARIDARAANKTTALFIACEHGHSDIASALLDAGADAHVRDDQDNTVVHEISKHGTTEILARVLKAKPAINAVNLAGQSALHVACSMGVSAELIKALLDAGIDAQLLDQQQQSAKDIAIEKEHWSLVAALDPDYQIPVSLSEGLFGDLPYPTSPRQQLRDRLLKTSSGDELAALQLEIDNDVSQQALSSLLIEFSGDSDLQRMQWLLQNGARADMPLEDGDSAFFHLLDRAGHSMASLNLLLERGLAPSGKGGLSRYLNVCLKNEYVTRLYENFALQLIERGADTFAAHSKSDAPLLQAIHLGWGRLYEKLLLLGVDPNQRDQRGFTALHLAASLGRATALKLLLKHGASIQARSHDGQTALGIALAANQHDLSRWLEWRNWQPPSRKLLPEDLPAAAISGDTTAVSCLLELGLSINATDAQGCTALLRAAGGGHEAMVRYLLSQNADHSIAARTGATALSAAISMRHRNVVTVLLQHQANPEQSLPGGVSPLMLSCALGAADIASLLISHGANANLRDAQGFNALHCAAIYAFSSRDKHRVLALFDMLLMADIEFDASTLAGQTPLHFLLGARAEAGASCDEELLLAALDRILSEGIHLDVQDQRGMSALHFAAMHGLLRVVQRLIREGAPRATRDSLGRTPHDLALLRGFVDVASEFETPRNTAPSMARFLRDPN